ncbi:MAG: hypothetical protein JSS07_00290 [Proteobacteria bacterium]|nr:hypothetical protein [Pseudomonadota bacterium]
MSIFIRLRPFIALIILIFCVDLLADPPMRVARLSATKGQISFLPAGEDTWAQALRNRPLITGDSLWNDINGNAMIQLGKANLCVGSNTALSLLNINDEIAQIQLSEGTVILVIDSRKEQRIEIDTPNLAFVAREKGYYRIKVDPKTQTTTVSLRNGIANVYGKTNSYIIKKNQSLQFNGMNLRYTPTKPAPFDGLNSWCNKNLPYHRESITLKYVAEDVVGYADLDRYGSWERIAEYGPVWTPSRVHKNWSPYQEGRWIWVDPWGWTWVGNEPWGFTPYHYGRWIYINNRWRWVPGPKKYRAVYAPALVVFISDEREKDISWIPLGPGEVYRPAYQVTEHYFYSINQNNTTVELSYVKSIYHRRETQIRYQNQAAIANFIAITASAFIESQQINKIHRKRVIKDQWRNAQIMSSPEVIPTATSVYGTRTTKIKPSTIINRPVIAVTQAPPPPVSFESKETLIKENRGKPLDEKEILKLQPATTTHNERKIEVISSTTPQDITSTPISMPEADKAQEKPAQEVQMREQEKAEQERALHEQEKTAAQDAQLREQEKTAQETAASQKQAKALEQEKTAQEIQMREQEKALEQERALREQEKTAQETATSQEQAKALEQEKTAQEIQMREQEKALEQERALREQAKAAQKALIREQEKALEQERALREQENAAQDAQLREQEKALEQERALREQENAAQEAQLREQEKAQEQERVLREQENAAQDAQLREQEKAQEQERVLREQKEAQIQAEKEAEEEAKKDEEAKNREQNEN